jgi:hypothetical protein
MRIRRWFAVVCSASLIAGTPLAAAQTGPGAAISASDGLAEVKSRYFDKVYVRPGADFRGYKKVMVDATQVTFTERWLSDLNEHRIAVLQGTTASQAALIAAGMRSDLRESFANVFKGSGYEIVAAPGADVLLLSMRLIDLHINAPDTVINALPSRVLTHEAGQATLVLELRDSASGTLLGRIIDRRMAGTRGPGVPGNRQGMRMATTASNAMDFGSLFDLWAWSCVDELKAQSPVALNAPVRIN